MIRPLRDADLPGIARVWRELRLDAVQSEAGVRHLLDTFPPRAQVAHWVATEGHDVVAWAFAHRRWRRASENAYVWFGVLPEARGRGIGGELWDLAERHVAELGVERVNADAVGDQAGERFLLARGFEHARTVVVSAVDPRSASTAVEPPPGYRLVPLADADLERLHRLDREVSGDTPGEAEGYEHSFEEWRRELARPPDFAAEGSFAVLHGDGLSAGRCSRPTVDHGPAAAYNEMHRHGSRPSPARPRAWPQGRVSALGRRRGDHARIVTENDAQNARMLAINARLGYRFLHGAVSWLREWKRLPRKAGSTWAVTQTGVVA